MILTPRSPQDGIYPATDYLHAIEVSAASRLLFISGTMGLDQDGYAPQSLDEQLTWIWSNIRRILAEAGMTVDNIVRVTSYLRDRAFVEANQTARLTALHGRRIPTTAIIAETLSPDWLVEIEAIAAG
ncbi:MAG: RidA family protein [Hyphomicrobiaceae bacterium]|nr:RidA family protein [Hyphomicrobiaceae bacterium]